MHCPVWKLCERDSLADAPLLVAASPTPHAPRTAMVSGKSNGGEPAIPWCPLAYLCPLVLLSCAIVVVADQRPLETLRDEIMAGPYDA